MKDNVLNLSLFVASEPVEKRVKLSDSLLDFDDDDELLGMDDDLVLDDNKDHEELMREIDELLS